MIFLLSGGHALIKLAGPLDASLAVAALDLSFPLEGLKLVLESLILSRGNGSSLGLNTGEFPLSRTRKAPKGSGLRHGIRKPMICS